MPDHKPVILTSDPIVSPIAEMTITPEGLRPMIDWVASHRPECLPREEDTNNPIRWSELFPHDLTEGAGSSPTSPRAARGLTSNELLVELAGRKCIAKGSLVLTTAGPKPVEAVTTADYVIVGEERHRVTGRACTGLKSVVRITTKAGYSLVCTPDHKILTATDWVEASDLIEGDEVILNAPTAHWGDVLDRGGQLERAGHCCGLFLGDGSFAGTDRQWANLRLFGQKRDLMPAVEEYLAEKARPWRRDEALSINSRIWAEQLSKFGVRVGVRTITPEIERAPRAFQKGVLGGLFDTDGSLEVVSTPSGTAANRRWILSSSDRPMLEAAQRMLLNFGIFSRIKLDKKAGPLTIQGVSTYGKGAWKLTVSGPGFQLFTRCIGTARVDRADLADLAVDMASKWIERKSYGTVVNVEEAGFAEVYDLSVEGAHRFGANGFVVHNCYDSFGLKAGKKTNSEYIANMQQGDVPHASVLYHAKMSFFIAGVSRRVSHELIRNYVGADRDEEGSPSQESTRFTHHYGYYIVHPYIFGLEDLECELEMGAFAQAMRNNYDHYLNYVKRQMATYEEAHGSPPKGMDRKRIYESASPYLSHACETSFIWTTNPMALAKMFRERDNDGADLEFRRLARVWKKVCLERWPNLFPQSWMR